MEPRIIPIADPPRSVSLSARLQAFFGGILNQVGWIMMAVGLLAAGIFTADSEAVTMLTFRGDKGTTVGKVVAVEDTHAEENETPVMKVRFSYEVEGKTYEYRSFTLNAPFDAGDTVPVEYLVARPSAARIQGMRMRTFGSFAVFAALFPLVGFLILARELGAARSRVRLLGHGRLARGRLVNKVETNTRINEQPVYALTYRYTVERQEMRPNFRGPAVVHEEHEVVYRTHLIAKVTDEAEEPLLYDPDRPSRAQLLDDLPGSVALDARGGFEASFGKTLVFLLAPIGCVLALLIALASAFG
ncbi:MAG: DUF3592 domain-containing protein [Myxococcales bacterium]|nr:DUF3592 domain-containing protein [Myxococcales bacterium]